MTPRGPPGVFSWALAAFVLLGSVASRLNRPVSTTDHVMAWKKTLGITPPAPVPKKPAEKISWPFKKSEFSPPFDVTTDGEFTPNAEQAATAVIRARELIDDYFPASITTELAVFVPVEDALGGVACLRSPQRQTHVAQGIHHRTPTLPAQLGQRRRQDRASSSIASRAHAPSTARIAVAWATIGVGPDARAAPVVEPLTGACGQPTNSPRAFISA